MRSRRIAIGLIFTFLMLTLLPLTGSAYDWPQFNFDMKHTGVDALETMITPSNVATLQRAWQVSLPGVADGSPSYLSGVVTPGGVKNLLFFTTKNGYITALDARNGAQVWAHQPATNTIYTNSIPVVDPNRQYVYSYALDGKVHKYQVGDGTEIVDAHWPEISTLKPGVEKQSSALAIAIARNGTAYLYDAMSAYFDQGDYQGHITTINLNTGAQNVFNTACSDLTVHFVANGTPGTDPVPNDCLYVGNSIWGRPGVVYDPDTDRIYFTSANGDFNANAGGYDWGDTVFALDPNGSSSNGLPLDSFTPSNYQYLQDQDLDLGSTSPVLLPFLPGSNYPHVAVQGGKEGKLTVINLDNMSGQGGPGHVGGELEQIDSPLGDEILPSPAIWVDPRNGGVWLFMSSYSGIAGLSVQVSNSKPHLIPVWHHGPGGSSPLVANGILYYASSGHLYALDPTTGNQLWSAPIGDIHWESPIVVNGTLYIADENAHLSAYTLNGATPCTVGYADVPNSNVFAAAIYNLACKGIAQGRSANLYAPAASATRAEFARMVLLGFGYPVQRNLPQDFSDVPPSYWAFNYIETAYVDHLISGYSDAQCRANHHSAPCFLPDVAITRAELTVMIVRAAHYTLTTPTTPTYPDVPPANFAYAAIETAHSKHIVSGYPDGSFRPNNNIRRDELTSILYLSVNAPAPLR